MNIKTLGPVDDRSLKQLRTCMEAGDAKVGYDVGRGNKAVY